MRKTGLIILFVALFAVSGFAQTYKVGDKVEFECNNCFGRNGWVAGTIENVTGETYQIRYGTERQQFRAGIPQRLLREADFANKEDKRQQFRKEAWQYRDSVFALMYVHDPNLRDGSGYRLPPTTGAEWTKLKAELTTLDNLCKSKYPGMTNGMDKGPDLNSLPATWCEIAARRNEYQTNAMALSVKTRYQVELKMMINAVDEAINGGYNGFIDEDVQLVAYEREKWRAMQMPKFQKGFTDLGVAMPADFFKDVEAKADQFKVVNERTAPTQSFLMPKHKDATVEAFIRSRYATEKKGVQILKIGLDDASWVIHRNSLNIPTSQTKVARLLVKTPNRPFCQEHSIAAERKYKGGSYGALGVDGGKVGAEGRFVRCE